MFEGEHVLLTCSKGKENDYEQAINTVNRIHMEERKQTLQDQVNKGIRLRLLEYDQRDQFRWRQSVSMLQDDKYIQCTRRLDAGKRLDKGTGRADCNIL